MLEMLRAEMKRSMQLMGCSSIRDLDHTWLTRVGGPLPSAPTQQGVVATSLMTGLD
jgi:hypothetical protein